MFQEMVKELKDNLNPQRIGWKRFTLACVGAITCGIAISFAWLAGFGLSPFSCMSQGVSAALGLGYGTYQVYLNILLTVPLLFYYRKSIGWGTLINMIFVGYTTQFCMFLWRQCGISAELLDPHLAVRIVLFLVGVLLLCIGMALYMACDMGMSPYDATGWEIHLLTNGRLDFAKIRIIMDAICVTLGALTGSVIGIGTVVFVCCIGPGVTFFRNKCMDNLITK